MVTNITNVTSVFPIRSLRRINACRFEFNQNWKKKTHFSKSSKN